MKTRIVNGVPCIVWYDKDGNEHVNAMGVVIEDEDERS